MRPKCRELFIGLVICMGAFCNGVGLGWSSAAYTKILDGELGYPVDKSQFKWFAALFTLGGVCMFFPGAFLANYAGPKFTMMVSIVSSFIGWGLVMLGNQLYYAYVGLFLIGITAASCLISSRLYIIHIAGSNIRGSMGILYQIMFGIGLTYEFVMGAILTSVTYFNIASIIPFSLYFFSLILVPESHVYYICQGKYRKALQSLRRLRGKNVNLDEEMEAKVQEIEALKQCETLFTRNLKAFLFSYMLQFFHQMAGVPCLTIYLTNILTEAKSGLSSKYVAVIYAATITLFIYISFSLIHRIGRKLCLVVSCIFLVIIGFFMSCYLMGLEENNDMSMFSWVPALAVVLYGCFNHLGLGSLALVVSVELLEEQFGTMAFALSSTINWFFQFILLIIFQPLESFIGLGQTFNVFGICNILAIAFTSSLPETKGKTFTEIQIELESIYEN